MRAHEGDWPPCAHIPCVGGAPREGKAEHSSGLRELGCRMPKAVLRTWADCLRICRGLSRRLPRRRWARTALRDLAGSSSSTVGGRPVDELVIAKVPSSVTSIGDSEGNFWRWQSCDAGPAPSLPPITSHGPSSLTIRHPSPPSASPCRTPSASTPTRPRGHAWGRSIPVSAAARRSSGTRLLA
jgi:hypothetical protein